MEMGRYVEDTLLLGKHLIERVPQLMSHNAKPGSPSIPAVSPGSLHLLSQESASGRVLPAVSETA